MNRKSEINRFTKGFMIGIILSLIFQAVTFIDFILLLMANFAASTSISIHRFWDFGFPFSMFSGMYLIFPDNFDFLAFGGNLIFAVVFSISVGLIFRYTNSLRSLMKSKFFVVGFLAGIISLIVLNYISYIQNHDGLCFDCMMFFGFPFKFVGYGGFVTHTLFFWYAFSLNLIIWGIISFYFGFFTELISRNRLIKKLK